MSDPKMMSVTEAQAWLDPSTGPKPEVPSPLLVDRYARTIVAQAEQIERLQAAVLELSREMEGYRPHEVAWVELTFDNILTMEDMEPPA